MDEDTRLEGYGQSSHPQGDVADRIKKKTSQTPRNKPEAIKTMRIQRPSQPLHILKVHEKGGTRHLHRDLLRDGQTANRGTRTRKNSSHRRHPVPSLFKRLQEQGECRPRRQVGIQRNQRRIRIRIQSPPNMRRRSRDTTSVQSHTSKRLRRSRIHSTTRRINEQRNKTRNHPSRCRIRLKNQPNTNRLEIPHNTHHCPKQEKQPKRDQIVGEKATHPEKYQGMETPLLEKRKRRKSIRKTQRRPGPQSRQSPWNRQRKNTRNTITNHNDGSSPSRTENQQPRPGNQHQRIQILK